MLCLLNCDFLVNLNMVRNLIKINDQRLFIFQPLFLYLSFQAVHQPLQVPKNFWLMYPDEENKKRRRYLGIRVVAPVNEYCLMILSDLQMVLCIICTLLAAGTLAPSFCIHNVFAWSPRWVKWFTSHDLVMKLPCVKHFVFWTISSKLCSSNRYHFIVVSNDKLSMASSR